MQENSEKAEKVTFYQALCRPQRLEYITVLRTANS
jgi:hypothetical protein